MFQARDGFVPALLRRAWPGRGENGFVRSFWHGFSHRRCVAGEDWGPRRRTAVGRSPAAPEWVCFCSIAQKHSRSGLSLALFAHFGTFCALPRPFSTEARWVRLCPITRISRRVGRRLALFARFGKIAMVSVAASPSWDVGVLSLFLLYCTKRARMGRAFRAILAVWSGLAAPTRRGFDSSLLFRMTHGVKRCGGCRPHLSANNR